MKSNEMQEMKSLEKHQSSVKHMNPPMKQLFSSISEGDLAQGRTDEQVAYSLQSCGIVPAP